MADIDLDIQRLHDAYAVGQDPVDVIDAVYRRIEAAADPGIFITLVDEATAKTTAAALPAFDPVAMPLWGVPFAVKDNIDVAGMPTTVACPDFAYVAKATGG